MILQWFSHSSSDENLASTIHCSLLNTTLCKSYKHSYKYNSYKYHLPCMALLLKPSAKSNEYYIYNLVDVYFNDMWPIFGSCFTQRPSSPPTLARQKTEARNRARQQFWVFSVKSKSFSKMLYFDLGAIFLWSFILGIKLDLSSEKWVTTLNCCLIYISKVET